MRSPRRSPAAAAVLLVLLLAAALLGLGPLERGLRLRLVRFAEEFRGRLEAETGLVLSFQSLSPSILRALSLEGLRIATPEGRVLLRADRLRVYYDLGALLSRGGEGFLTELGLERAEAELGQEDFRLISRLARRYGGESSNRLPAIVFSGRSLSLRVRDGSLDGLSLRLGRFRLDGSLAEPELEAEGLSTFTFPGLGACELPFSLRGALSRGFERARLRVGVSASSPSFVLARQDFDLTLERGLVALRKVRDSAALDLEARLATAEGLLSLSLGMEGFSPRGSLGVTGPLAAVEPWLQSSYTGKLSLELPLAEPQRLHFAAELGTNIPEEVLAGAYTLALKAEGGLRRIAFSEARLEGGLGSLSYAGDLSIPDLAPSGRLELDLALLGGRLPLRASCELFGSSGAYALLAERLRIGGAELSSLSLEAELRPKELGFALSALLPEPRSRPEPRGGYRGEALALPGVPRLKADGSLGLGGESLLELSLGLESASLEGLEPLLSVFFPEEESRRLASLSADGEVFLRTDFRRLSFSTTDLALVSSLLPDSYALVSASGTERSLKLRKALLSHGDYRAELSGGLEFRGPGRLGFDGSLVFADIPYAFSGSLVGDSLFVEGDYSLKLGARVSRGEYFVSLSASSLPLPIPGFPLIASLDADGRYASPEDWSLAFAALSLETAPGQESPLDIPGLSLTGLFGPEGGKLVSVDINDARSELKGKGELSWSLSPDFRIEGRLDLAAPSGESYALKAGYSAAAVSGSLELKGSPIDRFWKGPLTGLVDGSLGVEGRLENPRLRFEGKLREALLSESPISLELAGSWAEGRLELGSGRANWRGLELTGLGGDFSLPSGEGRVRGSFRASDGVEALSFGFEAQAASPSRGSTLAESLADYRVEGRLRNFSYRSFTSPDWPFTLRLGPETLSFLGGQSRELSFETRNDGSFAAVAASPFPLRFDARGRIRAGQIEADANGLLIDLPLLLSLAKDLPVAFEGGRVEGDLAIRGPLADPEFSGSLRLDGLHVYVPGWIGGSVGPIDAPILVDGKRLALSLPSVPVGDSRIGLAADALLDGWLPSRASIKVRSFPDWALPLDARILGIHATGSAFPSLDFDFSEDAVSITGSVLVEKADVVLGTEILGNEGSDAASRLFLSLGLGFRFGKGVRVYFPSKEFPIVSGYADPSSRLDLAFDQARQDLSLKGEAFLRGGEVFYIQRNFFLKNARIAFNETLDKFDPLVTLLAELRDSTDQGPVIVTLRADNAPIANFQPRLSSDPPLSESEIALILGESLLAMDETGSMDWRRLAIASSEFLPQLNVSRVFESRVREALGLDVFFVRTQAIQRWLFDMTGAGMSGAATLGDYLDETSLYAGKYLGDSVFLHGELRLQDPLVPSGNFRLDSEVGVEFDTPFGTLQWNVNPRRPETLFIGDQSLSLSWRLVY